MKAFLGLIGVVAALCMVGSLIHAGGSDNGIVEAVSIGHAIELAILMVVCLTGGAVLGAIEGIAETITGAAGKPKAEPPPFGQKREGA